MYLSPLGTLFYNLNLFTFLSPCSIANNRAYGIVLKSLVTLQIGHYKKKQWITTMNIAGIH